MSKRGGTHLHHLLYVFLDDRGVGVGLHRHRPVIDHGGLGVRRGGGAGVLLQWMRKQKNKKINRREINMNPGREKL